MQKLISRFFAFVFIAALAFVARIPIAQATDSPEEIQYFYGPISYMSVDEKRLYRTSASLVKRTISPSQGIITEVILQPGEHPGDKAKEYTTILKRDGSTSTFHIDNAEQAMASGTMTFTSGSDWKWSAWTYDITILDGSKLSGHGELADKTGVTTQKVISSVDGQPQVKFYEDLFPISAADYERLEKRLRSPE